MLAVGTWILGHTEWLYVRLHENRLFFLDYWSFVHLWFGVVLSWLLLWARARRPWLVLTMLLVSWELLELSFIYIAFHAFRPETLKDQVTDVLVGLLGGLATSRAAHRAVRVPARLRRPSLHPVTAGFAAATVSFVWVGSYQYRYNVEAFNTAGVSWWAYCLWSIGLWTAIELYLWGRWRLRGRWSSLLAVWAIHAAVLLLVEYVGHDVLHIREVSKAAHGALIGGLIHGTKALFAFYLTAPLLGIAVHEAVRTLSEGAIRGAGAVKSLAHPSGSRSPCRPARCVPTTAPAVGPFPRPSLSLESGGKQPTCGTRFGRTSESASLNQSPSATIATGFNRPGLQHSR